MEEKKPRKRQITQEGRLIEDHIKTLWAHFGNIFLGFWLLVSHIILGYTSFGMIVSDMVMGAVFILFGFLSLSRRILLAPWIVCFGGIWLQFAPLFFFAPESAAYLNDTLVGVGAIALSILIPGIPGLVEETNHSIPPGWSYNPSAWIQRIPVITLGCVGWMISRYLAAYQLGYIDTMWDPVFGDGTRLVITSSVAKFFPWPDAGLGAFAYSLEALMGCKGGQARWRTMPWMVIAFAFLVVPLGIVSIVLVILQPLLVGHWCFLCLCAASSMLIMVTLTVDEMFAVIQFLHHAKKEGLPFWRTFWKGGDVKGTKDDTRTPTFDSSPFALFATWRFGIAFRWNLVLAAALGVWLMFTPAVFHLGTVGSNSDHLLGALTVVCSIIALAEVALPLRYLLLPFGLWIAFTSWLFPGHHLAADSNHLAVGLLLILLSLPRGKLREGYGSINKWIK